MTSLFERMKNNIMADLHGWFDHKEKKNPIAMLNQYLRDCESEVKKIEKLLERQYLLKEEVFSELKYAENMAKKRSEQKTIAMNANQTSLHELILREQQQYENQVAFLQQSYEETIHQLEQLEKKYRDMKMKLKDMHLKRLELMGKENMTNANQKMNKVLGRIDEPSAFSKFDEVQHYIDFLEQKVEGKYRTSMIDVQIAQLQNTKKLDDKILSENVN
ncbi:phage shock protein A [Oikeobacillus pervagus]|uniref:Phage shock protein A n=1 Tax=Oikeobacillus pervagus TaxID=1325931 RepID=A0AAJ1SX26_9BACI|nr:PspA/IM30 family protein [Oikeobacillus pervagus]MDQ0214345.1 phage shock protein A [Oikeobacillus pervagus]